MHGVLIILCICEFLIGSLIRNYWYHVVKSALLKIKVKISFSSEHENLVSEVKWVLLPQKCPYRSKVIAFLQNVITLIIRSYYYFLNHMCWYDFVSIYMLEYKANFCRARNKKWVSYFPKSIQNKIKLLFKVKFDC